MFRLIATDLDDTLLNAGSDLTERTTRALEAAMKAGVKISLSSGRMREAMVPFAERVGVNAPMILYNGAMIYDHRTGETLFKNPIAFELAREVAKTIESMGIYLQVYPGDGYFCNEKTEHTRAYEKSVRVECTELHQPVSEWMSGDMIKMLAIDTPEGIARIQPILQEKFPKNVHFMKSKPHYLEIVAEGNDKGVALKKLGEALNVAREEIIAFGDGQNDASMLAYAGTGVAMENANPECKKAADMIAPKNTEDGVAQIIEQYLAEGKMGG